MRFVHLADLHLGKKVRSIRGDILLDHSKAIEEVLYIIKQFKPQFLFICGDVFHYKTVSNDAEELFTNFIIHSYELVDYTFVISGNHDNDKKLQNIAKFNNYINKILQKKVFIYTFQDLYINDLSPISIDNVDIIPLPFIEQNKALEVYYKLKDKGDEVQKDLAYSFLHRLIVNEFLKKSKNHIKILLGHLYMENSQNSGTESKKYINPQYLVKIGDIDSNITYCALGHIHKSQQIRSNIYYSGSLIQLDFSENFDHGIIIGQIVNNFPSIQFQKVIYKEFITLKVDINNFQETINFIENNKDKYIKILYSDSSISFSSLLNKLNIFENILKIQKENIVVKTKNDVIVDSNEEFMDPSDIVGSFRNFIYKSDLNIGEDKKNLFLQEIEKIYEEVENDYA